MKNIWDFFIGIFVVIGLVFISLIMLVMLFMAIVVAAIKEIFRGLK